MALSLVSDMRIHVSAHLFFIILLVSPTASCEDGGPVEFTGVVTFQLLPAKVLRINEIVADPEPGTSYIGDAAVLVEVEENPEVMANWTVVTAKYLEYTEPKTIRYEILNEQYEVSVKYYAISVEVTGDLSEYITE